MMPLAEVSCQLARLFISAGADMDAINKEGQTPIMVAILQVSFLHLCIPNVKVAHKPVTVNLFSDKAPPCMIK